MPGDTSSSHDHDHAIERKVSVTLMHQLRIEIESEEGNRTCFHNRIISGISNIAFFLSSNFPLIALSHLWPLTFWPIPVPLTLRPFSISLACLYSVDFRPGGNSSSTPYLIPNLTNSACRRSDITAPRHRPVSGFL